MIPPGYHGLGVISWGATIRHSWVFTLDIDFFLWPVDEKNFSTMITWVGDEFSSWSDMNQKRASSPSTRLSVLRHQHLFSCVSKQTWTTPF